MRDGFRPSGVRRSRTNLGAGALALGLLALARAAGVAQEGAREEEPPPFVLAEPAPIADGVPAEAPGWRSMSCARCHVAIAREWAGTRHALAWIDPHYQEALAKVRRPESCRACHIPAPLHGAEQLAGAALPTQPAVRERRLHHGVDCRACHEGPQGELLGPYGATTYAHESVRSESFTAEGSNRLCAVCHATHIGPVVGVAKDFVASDQAARGRSCVGCHMAPLERSAAHDPDGDGPSPVRKGRSHALQTPRDPAFLRQAFGFELERRGERSVLRVENRAGHRVPGLEGREIELVATAFDPRGDRRAEQRFVLSKDSYLPVEQPLELWFELPAERVHLRGIHRASGFAEPVEFLALELEPEQ